MPIFKQFFNSIDRILLYMIQSLHPENKQSVKTICQDFLPTNRSNDQYNIYSTAVAQPFLVCWFHLCIVYIYFKHTYDGRWKNHAQRLYTLSNKTQESPEHVETWMQKINYIRFYFFKKFSFGGLSHIDREQVEYNNNMYTTLLSAIAGCICITLTTHTDGRSPV